MASITPRLAQTFDRKSEADAWAAKMEGKFVEGQIQALLDSERHLLGDLIDLFIAGPLQLRPAN